MKRITIIALFIAISASINFSTVAAQSCGNFDGDPGGITDIGDLTYLIAYLFLDSPPSVEDIDVDDFEGVSVRDFLFLQNFLGINFDPLFCPPANPRIVAMPDSSFSVSFSNRIPAGSGFIRIPIYLDTDRDLSGIQLPVQYRIGGVIPSIDSLHLNDLPFALLKYDRIVQETGETVINFFPFHETLHLFDNGPGPFLLANLFLSYPPSNTDRVLSTQWSFLSPIQAVEPDSTIIPAVYSSVSEGAIAWEPILSPFVCGDVDGSGGQPDIADLTFLIDHLFINFPPLANPLTGNVDGSQNGDGSSDVDIADLTFLIDHLFINFPQVEC